MKSLKNILSKNSNFHSLNDILQESLRIGINDNPYTANPKTWDELRQIIIDRYEEFGSGTNTNPIDLNDIDISGITTFFNDPSDAGLFEGIPFEYIDISDWDVSQVEDMRKLFFKCRILKSVGDLSSWDISSVKDIYGMFYACKSLKSVGNLSNWDVSNVKDMRWIFDDSGITNIPNWYKG